MKYYDTEAFSGDDKELLEGVYCSNDSFFLNNIYSDLNAMFEPWELLEPGEVPQMFRDILIKFYNNYPGDKLSWLHHTMNIVYVFDDFAMWIWLTCTLDKLEADTPPRAKDILKKHKTRILKREESLESVFKQLSEIYGHKWTYYNKLWKTIKK